MCLFRNSDWTRFDEDELDDMNVIVSAQFVVGTHAMVSTWNYVVLILSN